MHHHHATGPHAKGEERVVHLQSHVGVAGQRKRVLFLGGECLTLM
jgi:hypothetical protein